jgi:ABC-type nitrate/sulfonate/bicarbonate transport system substrate-binding protein
MKHSSYMALCCSLALAFLHPTKALAQAYFDAYGLASESPTVDVGVQPLGYPSGVISAVMQRDRILKKTLLDAKLPLKMHPFRRGADMLGLLSERKLDAGLLGDMPTILAASVGRVVIVGLVKQTSTAIVARGTNQVAGLSGKRIAFVEASSAHHTLLQGLASAGIAQSQVNLVPLGVGDMPEALERGDVDAFAAWEPAPTIAMGKSEKNHIVFRGQSSDYFVLEQDFVQRSPQAARHVVASFYRAIEWMRRSPANLNRAARWALADTTAFSGKPAQLGAVQVASITHREILSIPSAPTLLINPAAPPLKGEYQFLSGLGKLPAAAQWENVEKAFRYDGLAQVLNDARTYRLRSFDYDN